MHSPTPGPEGLGSHRMGSWASPPRTSVPEERAQGRGAQRACPAALPGVVGQDPGAAERLAWSGLDAFTGHPGNTCFSISDHCF